MALITRASAMELLKHSTRQQHAKLERSLDLLDPRVTRESYRQLLERFYGYYLPWEQLCRPWIDELEPRLFDQRLKSPMLEEDLDYLTSGDRRLIPRCTRMPEIHSPAQALGSMYVMEGSTLGGRLLSRHFSASLSIDAGTGGSFFAGYGERTGQMWREFAAMVESHAGLASAPMAIEAAQRTFQTLGDWLIDGQAKDERT